MTAPISFRAAATELGICVNTLRPFLKDFPYYERRGAKKVFYSEHIKALREAIDRCSRSQPILSPASSKLAAPSGARELELARAHATERRRRLLRRQSNASTGNVVPLESGKP